ncbi:hypothetical protein Cgig2_007330 [Carnegiea gigantea]|uniref:Uncharacterized protein n=1 Tax=Carnegiea gigantea TaxID=171969 RepID=A0A9Q1L0F0_9CARY|nr:hypothetical protein Cgig2_007330 [Carnegiea gigantea]
MDVHDLGKPNNSNTLTTKFLILLAVLVCTDNVWIPVQFVASLGCVTRDFIVVTKELLLSGSSVSIDNKVVVVIAIVVPSVLHQVRRHAYHTEAMNFWTQTETNIRNRLVDRFHAETEFKSGIKIYLFLNILLAKLLDSLASYLLQRSLRATHLGNLADSWPGSGDQSVPICPSTKELGFLQLRPKKNDASPSINLQSPANFFCLFALTTANSPPYNDVCTGENVTYFSA